jgi:uncharacterized protein (TIGR03435 family)
MTRTMLLTSIGVTIGAPMLALAAGQSQRADAPAQPQPQFEVASIKPNKSGDGRMMMGVQPGGRLNAINVTLKMLIRNAYQVQDFQIVGGEKWINDDRFDVIAKAEDGDTENPFRATNTGEPSRGQLMMRSLLAERFKLAVHDETREMPIYALVLAHNDGKLGPQIQKSSVDCQAMSRSRGPGAGSGTGPGAGPGAGPGPADGKAMQGPPGPGDRMPCGIRVGPGNMSVGGVPLSQFAASLGMWVGRIVVDKTGLTGNYDFNLTWTPDQMPQRPPGMGGPEPPPIDPNGPSIYTAVQEQLGLKLDSQKGPVTVLVIDHAEHPVED